MAMVHAGTRPHLDGVEEHFAGCASAVDGGDRSTRDALRFLGERALLDVGVGGGRRPGTLVGMVDVITTVARACMSSAFSAWAQRMMLEYVAVAEPGFAGDGLLDGLASGDVAGSTAMASAFQDLAGLAPLPVTFTRRGGDLHLDGNVRWASNLFDDGFWVALAARGGDGERVVVALPSSTPGLTVDPGPELLALGATASSSLRLADVVVPPELVVSHDVGPFLAAVRRPFLCLQAAFCVGLAEASLRAIDARPGAGYGQFDGEREALALDVADVTSRLHGLAAGGLAADGDALPRLLSMRLDAARLASTAVHLEVKVTGGAAYLAHSATARRLREAAFLPIQSPTEAHLRWELAACNS